MVEQWHQSGISQRQFCEKNQIKLSTFGYWVLKYNEAKISDPGFASLRISPEPVNTSQVPKMEIERDRKHIRRIIFYYLIQHRHKAINGVCRLPF